VVQDPLPVDGKVSANIVKPVASKTNLNATYNDGAAMLLH
jgi:hypothetical protein